MATKLAVDDGLMDDDGADWSTNPAVDDGLMSDDGAGLATKLAVDDGLGESGVDETEADY